MQFVGRIMRVLPDVDPFSEVNEGVVVSDGEVAFEANSFHGIGFLKQYE